MTRERDEEILAALALLRSGASLTTIAAHFRTDKRNLAKLFQNIKSADAAHSGEDVSYHYGRVK
jgi:hypothetical protein